MLRPPAAAAARPPPHACCRRRDLLSGQKRAANRLACTALNHHRRGSLGLREAASCPAYGEALKAQRRVVPVYGKASKRLPGKPCACCSNPRCAL